jgi:osmotically inducible protein OsmC
MKRNATAVWSGTGKDGKGNLTTQSGILNETQYSFGSRFENGIGTNPEELIAAAHSGCFTMKLAFNLQAEGFAADELKTKCVIVLEEGKITESNLTLEAKIKGISEDKFAELVKDAEANCPISKLLDTKISVEYTLN